MTVTEFLGRFERVAKAGDGWLVRCPAHDDAKASLSVGEGAEGKILLRCHAGCPMDAILVTLGLETKDLFTTERATRREVATYDYRDSTGALRYQVVRFEPKDFRQRRPDGSGGWIWNLQDTPRVLYRLPELRGHREVVIVEGEKDADRLWALGIPATTSVGGAGKWRDAYTRQLLEVGVERLILIPDHDEPGRQHMAQVAASWAPQPARLVTLADVPPKGDVSDYLATHAPEALRALLREPVAPLRWLDADAQLAAMAAEDEEAVAGRRVHLDLPQIDQILGGIRRGEVCGLMGRPGIGKTLVLTHVASALTGDARIGHVCFSLEMPAAQIVARLQQRLYNLFRQKREELARAGRLDLDRYREAFRSFVLVDTPGLSVSQMEGLLRQIADGPLKGTSIGLVTIDHLGLVGGDRKLTTYDRVSLQAREIKELAKRFQCAVLLAVQVNRDGGGDGSKELGLGSARDSGVVEEAMDYLGGLRRLDRSLELAEAEREKFRDVLFAKVVKNRHGEADGREVAYRLLAMGLQLEEDRSIRPSTDVVARIVAMGNRR